MREELSESNGDLEVDALGVGEMEIELIGVVVHDGLVVDEVVVEVVERRMPCGIDELVHPGEVGASCNSTVGGEYEEAVDSDEEDIVVVAVEQVVVGDVDDLVHLGIIGASCNSRICEEAGFVENLVDEHVLGEPAGHQRVEVAAGNEVEEEYLVGANGR